MTAPRSVERLGHYRTTSGQPFYIAEVVPSKWDGRRLKACADGIASVLHSSWTAKFVPHVLSASDLAGKLPTGDQIESRISEGSARYLVAVDGIMPVTNHDQIMAFARVEDYKPRRPTRANPLRRPYPNITDLESRDGQLRHEPTIPRLALLHHAVSRANPRHKVSAYTEQPNAEGIRFYKDYGFKRDDSIPPAQLTETIGDSSLTYVHMEAATANPVQGLALDGLAQYFDNDV